MNRLLKAQLKKAFGKEFDINTQDEKFKKFLELVQEGYNDFNTERKMLENTLEVNAEELTESNRELTKNHELIKSVTNSVSDIIFYKDFNFKYIGCNRHFELLVGKLEQDIIGTDDYDLFDKEYADQFRRMDKLMLESSKEQTNKEWVKFPNGEEAYFSTHKAPLLNISGNKIGIVGVSRNITNEYKLEQEIKNKQALLIQQGRLASMGDMIGNIAHQWRQPLNTLGLIIQKVGFYNEEDSLDKETIRTNVNKCMSIIFGMSETIDDFRDFFNPNKEKIEFSIKDSIEKAYQVVEPLFKNINITYEMKIKEDYFVNGFKNEFSQVILNILNNAKDSMLEHNIEKPSVVVEIVKMGDNVIINIVDNGGGISEEQLEKIYDPYFTTKAEGKGTGLGLYMSKMIIEDHMDGKLSATNTKDGVKFTISIKSDCDV